MKLAKLLKEVAQGWEELTGSDLEQYRDELFNLIQIAYQPIGGHLNIKSKNDINLNDLSFWIASDVDDDNEYDAMQPGKSTKFGVKLTVGASDGGTTAKRVLIRKLKSLLNTTGFYLEASEKLESILDRLGLQYIDDPLEIKTVLNKEIQYIGDGWYNRDIGGKIIKKRLYGKPKL